MSEPSTDIKRAEPDHPIHELLMARWSPYGFADDPVPRDDLLSLLEAARWAPSSFNEQPWRFIIGQRGEPAWDGILECLVDANQAWARKAPVLLLTVPSLLFARNGKPNTAAHHDIGLAMAQLCVEATARGLHVHQMIGIHPERAQERFTIPEGHEAFTAAAIGRAARLEDVPEALRERDAQPRTRKPLSEFVFGDAFGSPSSLTEVQEGGTRLPSGEG
jgi:nitroreductase